MARSLSSWRGGFVCAGFISLVIAGSTGCSSTSLGAQTPPDDATNARATHGGGIPVTTTTVQQKPIAVTVQAVGAVESISTVQIHAQVTGQLSDVFFDEGQSVQKGQPLFALDPRPLAVALKQAEAVLAKDRAQAANAEAARARSQQLFDRGLISRNDYDAQVAGADAFAATVEADNAAVEAAQLNLAYTHIMAPASGRTGALQVHVGDLVRANDTTPMVVINQLAPIYVAASVPGNLLGDIRRSAVTGPLHFDARVDGPAGPVSAGRLTFVDNAVDGATGAIKIKGEFANADGALWPGQFVDVTLQLRVDPRAIVVPSLAVQQGQQGSYAYVVGDDDTVQLRPVTVARTEGADSVISSGLQPGERVVTDGQLRLQPGTRVTEQASAAPPAETER